MITLQFRRAVEQVVARLFGATEGHDHSGVDWEGPKVTGGNVDATWVDWTPTVTQSVAVSVTVTEAKYCLIGKVCHIYAVLAVTGAGTSGEVIKVAGLPTAAQPAIYGRLPAGTGYCNDAGVAEYAATVIPNAANDIWLVDTKTQAWVGTSPAFALANTDKINFSATWRVA